MLRIFTGKVKSVNLKTKINDMPTAKSKKETPGITVVKKMKDYSKDPYFVKKAERARAFLEKHPLPESFTKRKSKS